MCVVTYTTSPISNNSTKQQAQFRIFVRSRDPPRDWCSPAGTEPLTCSGPPSSVGSQRGGSATHGSHASSSPRAKKMQQIITCTRSAGASATSNPAPGAPGHPESTACMPLRRQAPRDMRGWEGRRHPRDVPTFWNEWRRGNVQGAELGFGEADLWGRGRRRAGWW